MLVRFSSRASGDIIMFGDVAIALLRLMGHSGTVPSALRPEDIPQALQRLKAALGEQEAEAPDAPAGDPESGGEQADRPVSLRTRAFPLIELLEAAAAEDVTVMWEPQ